MGDFGEESTRLERNVYSCIFSGNDMKLLEIVCSKFLGDFPWEYMLAFSPSVKE